jgi:hypothetical protein
MALDADGARSGRVDQTGDRSQAGGVGALPTPSLWRFGDTPDTHNALHQGQNVRENVSLFQLLTPRILESGRPHLRS